MTGMRGKNKWARILSSTLALGLGVGALSLGNLVGTAPAALANTPNFNPLSVTFVALNTGWALGTVPCPSAGACLALRQTFNAGSSWSPRPLPAGLVAAARHATGSLVVGGPSGSWLNVRFANVLDGWVYGGFPNGGPVLWSTHNGGSTWQRDHLPGLSSDAPLLDLEAAHGTAYFMALTTTQQRVVVESSPVGHEAWRLDQTPALFLPAGGGELGASIVLQGGKGWLVEGNDRGITGSAELQSADRWRSWAPPCQNVGNSFTVPAASTANNLVAICVMGGFASPLSSSAPPGAKLGSTWLYFSSNGGQSFQAGPELGQLGGPFFGQVLGSPAPNAIITSRSSGTSNQLVASFNGGHNWNVVFRGNLFYLGFTSPDQGVGLVQSSSASRTSMIMTFDSGHHWSRVNF
jgi:hypothetical protein